VIVNYHLRTLHAPFAFATHLLVAYALTFLTFSSLIVCVSRDPGPVTQAGSRAADDGQEIELTQALMFDQSDSDDESATGSYCFRCDAPKPERTRTYFLSLGQSTMIE
jgi:palmitoyltransferase ZDHHC2/15/20